MRWNARAIVALASYLLLAPCSTRAANIAVVAGRPQTGPYSDSDGDRGSHPRVATGHLSSSTDDDDDAADDDDGEKKRSPTMVFTVLGVVGCCGLAIAADAYRGQLKTERDGAQARAQAQAQRRSPAFAYVAHPVHDYAREAFHEEVTAPPVQSVDMVAMDVPSGFADPAQHEGEVQ